MNDFDFNEDRTGKDLATAAVWALGIIFFALSALTTGQFFMYYAPGLGAWAGPDVGPWIAALQGVLLLDAAAIAWGYVRARSCTTETQITISLVAAIATMIGALLTSVVYILLTSNLEVGITNADGSLTSFGTALNMVGSVVLVLALVVNFGGIFLFQNKDIGIQRALGRARLSAQNTQQKLGIALDRQRLVNQAESSRVAARLPQVARDLGTQSADNYIDAMRTGTHRSQSAPAKGKYRAVTISLLGKIGYSQSIYRSLAEAYEGLSFGHTDAGGWVIDAVTGLPADEASQKAADHFGWEPHKHGFPPPGNGITRPISPINMGEDVEPSAPPRRMASESPNVDRPELRRANQNQQSDPVALMVQLMGEETTKRVLDQILPK